MGVLYDFKFSPLNRENILKNFGGIDANSLEKMIDFVDHDNNSTSFKHSPYYEPTNLPQNLKRNKTNLTALSLNVQCLGSKFNSLETMLKIFSDQDVEPDLILIQESWLKDDVCPPFLELRGYNAIAQGYRCSTHGGLITYIKSHLTATKIDICPNSSVFEGLVLKIENPEDKSMPNTIVTNIYKPPHNNNNRDNIEKFIDEITPILKYINE